MGDRDAIKQIRLDSLIQVLPGLYCAIGDCAYTPTEPSGSYISTHNLISIPVNYIPFVNRSYSSAVRILCRYTMMRGPGPPLPLGDNPNGVNTNQPKYTFDTEEWKKAPNLRN